MRARVHPQSEAARLRRELERASAEMVRKDEAVQVHPASAGGRAAPPGACAQSRAPLHLHGGSARTFGDGERPWRPLTTILYILVAVVLYALHVMRSQNVATPP